MKAKKKEQEERKRNCVLLITLKKKKNCKNHNFISHYCNNTLDLLTYCLSYL